MKGTHEVVREHATVKGASNRAFGLTVGGILLALGVLRAVFAHAGMDLIAFLLLGIGAILVILGQVRPKLLSGANRAWASLGTFLAKVVNPIILFVVFATTVVPIGLLRRAMGKKSMGTQPDPAVDTYWQDRQPERPTLETLRNQF